MIGLEEVYVLAGLMFGAFALGHARDAAAPRRWPNALFWGAYAPYVLSSGDASSGCMYANGASSIARSCWASLGIWYAFFPIPISLCAYWAWRTADLPSK